MTRQLKIIIIVIIKIIIIIIIIKNNNNDNDDDEDDDDNDNDNDNDNNYNNNYNNNNMIIIKQFCETKNACSNVAGCSWILEQVRTLTSYLKMILNKCRQSIAFVVKHLTVSFWSHYL